MIDKKTASLLDQFGTLSASLLANVQWIGNMCDEQPSVSPQVGVNLERLISFSGVIDTGAVNAFLLQHE